jgi:hypothetical protein
VRQRMASWTNTASNWRNNRSMRMSPWMCSHSGFSSG